MTICLLCLQLDTWIACSNQDDIELLLLMIHCGIQVKSMEHLYTWSLTTTKQGCITYSRKTLSDCDFNPTSFDICEGSFEFWPSGCNFKSVFRANLQTCISHVSFHCHNYLFQCNKIHK